MTVTSPARPLTTWPLLFGEAAHGADRLAAAIDEQALADAFPKLSRAGRAAAGAELAEVARGLLDVDLAGIAVGGWRKHRELLAAATRTVEHPATTEVVPLATHCITSIHQPSVDVLVDGVQVAVVRLELTVELLVQALVATVRGGHLVGIRSGSFDVRVALAVAGRQLAERRTSLASPLFVALGDGVPLPAGITAPTGASASMTHSPRRTNGQGG